MELCFRYSSMVLWRRWWHPTAVLLPGKSHGRRSLAGCSPWGRWESDKTEPLRFHFSLSCIGEGNGNPLQCSCLEGPRGRGAWWAAIYGDARSQTRLKWLSSSSSMLESLRTVTAAMKLKRCLLFGRKSMTNLDSVLKSRHRFVNKGPSSQSYGFSSSHVLMWKLDQKEDWVPKNWCFQTVVLEKTLEISLDCREIKPVSPKGNQPWLFIARTDAEAKVPIFSLPDVKNWLTGKDPDAGKDWGKRKRGRQRMRRSSNHSATREFPIPVISYVGIIVGEGLCL